MVNKKRPTNNGLPSNPFDTEPEVYATQEAAAISKKIEALLLEGKKPQKRRKEGVKILLLGRSSYFVSPLHTALNSSIGQSESGKVSLRIPTYQTRMLNNISFRVLFSRVTSFVELHVYRFSNPDTQTSNLLLLPNTSKGKDLLGK